MTAESVLIHVQGLCPGARAPTAMPMCLRLFLQNLEFTLSCT